MRRRWYILWHDDSPGTRVTVCRWWRPRGRSMRIGEPFVYGRASTYPEAIDLTTPEEADRG